ncbi:hypothetical protein ACFQWF_15085 [Methylorubrum suomiense]
MIGVEVVLRGVVSLRGGRQIEDVIAGIAQRLDVGVNEIAISRVDGIEAVKLLLGKVEGTDIEAAPSRPAMGYVYPA